MSESPPYRVTNELLKQVMEQDLQISKFIKPHDVQVIVKLAYVTDAR